MIRRVLAAALSAYAPAVRVSHVPAPGADGLCVCAGLMGAMPVTVIVPAPDRAPAYVRFSPGYLETGRADGRSATLSVLCHQGSARLRLVLSEQAARTLMNQCRLWLKRRGAQQQQENKP